MAVNYSQWKAFKALCIAALRSIMKSPSSVVFTIAFPLIFILVFGFFRDTGFNQVKIAFAPDTDNANPIVSQLEKDSSISIVGRQNSATLKQMLVKNEIGAILEIHNNANNTSFIRLEYASGNKGIKDILYNKIQNAVLRSQPALQKEINSNVAITETVVAGRSPKVIDFILPGQLGFSLLAASIFGTAFVFFNLRQTLVLKRFFATPVRKSNILLAEGVARMIFQIAGALLIIFIGRYFLGFTLVNGAVTVINMLILCALALLVFMSFGFIISGIAKSESTIPPLSNIITLPQFLLAGTFFSISVFPTWLQYIARVLPLTYFNDAMRKIASDGASLWQVRTDIGIMLLWGIAGYIAAARVFRWE